MYKLLACCILLAVSVAAAHLVPSAPLFAVAPLLKSSDALIAEPTHIQVHEPALAKVGDVIESVPTAVSHQSSTIVHSRAQRITPLVAPAVRSYTAPAVRTYNAPQFVAASPMSLSLLRAALPAGLGPAAAFVRAHAHAYAPSLQLRAFGHGVADIAAPIYRSYGLSYGTPVVYADFKK